MTSTKLRQLAGSSAQALAVMIALASIACAQASPPRPASPRPASADTVSMAEMAMNGHAMTGPMDENMMKHMELTPLRVATHADSIRATAVAAELKRAIARYQDTAAAVADGYRMFLPDVKTQKVFHFTSNRRALLSALHFDPAKPTSILYARGADGRLHLQGAMYTLGKNASLDRLNDRVPLGIARWHKHVNWCLPRKHDQARWTEQQNGHPVFGPESPIASKAACDAVHGEFHENVFGWMLHANVFAGAGVSDLAAIFGDDHSAAGNSEHRHP